MKLISWNVNGIRAVVKKGFLDFLHTESPDMLFLQETKAMPEQVAQELLEHEHYTSYWHSAERKGYSGTALLTKIPPIEVTFGVGIPRFDEEGRVICAHFEETVVYGIYFPNGGRPERLPYKLDFYDYLLAEFDSHKNAGKKVVVCGDFNVAHEPIDLARPKENVNTSGFLQVERNWFSKLIAHGYVDTFRHFHPNEPEHYSYWDQRFQARLRNVGWRIDYFVVSENTMPFVQDAFILPEVLGSDHCPVGIELTHV